MLPHDLGDLHLTGPGQAGPGQCRKMGGVERRVDRPVPVRAERDVVLSGDLDRGCDGLGHVGGRRSADHVRPDPDADDPARLRDVRDQIVGQVAGAGAMAGDAGMGQDRPRARNGQHVAHHLRAGMGHVDDHPARDHRVRHLTPEIGQARAGTALSVQAAAQFVVEEMRQPHQPEARVIEHVQIGQIAFKRVTAFGSQHRAQHLRACLPPRQMVGQIGAAADHPQPVSARLRGVSVNACARTSARSRNENQLRGGRSCPMNRA